MTFKEVAAAPQRGLLLVPDESHAMTLMHAVNRLRAKSPIPFDLADGWNDNRVTPANYDMTIVLGVTAPAATAAKNQNNKLLAQAWSGNRPRAVLYAAWELADLIALGKIPIMAYLDEDLRARIDKHNKLGLFILSDAEYFGGGSLPNAIDRCHIHAMRQLLERNSDFVVFRTELHDRTPYGTLWSTAGIQLEQAAAQLWTPTPPPQDVWTRWIERRWGAQAAPCISKALANSYDIIFNGLTLDGLNDMFKSTISARQWMTNWLPGERKMMMFARPGTHLLKKKPDIVTSTDQFSVQLNNIAMTFKEFEARQKKAADQIADSLAQIEQAKPYLAKTDYLYLTETFNNAKILVPVIHDMAQAAYAANLTKDNFDNNPDPKAYFETSIRNLEARAASKDVQWLSTERKYLHGNIAEDLGKIATAYRQYVDGNSRWHGHSCLCHSSHEIHRTHPRPRRHRPLRHHARHHTLRGSANPKSQHPQ